MNIRWPVDSDLPELVDIYNQAIRSGVATGHTQEFENVDRMNWFKNHDQSDYPIYVLELDHKIIGYGSLSPYRKGRQAMRTIAEVSFFLDEAYSGQGYGSVLLMKIIEDCPRLKIKTLLAILIDINEKSIGLLEKFGFQKWGHIPDVIEFEDKTCGHLIYGLKISGIKDKMG